jgi:hypothetical protein
MSLGADSDSSENVNERNPVPVYSSSLLQQFAEKTALLSEPRKRRGGKQQLTKRSSGESREPEYASASNVSPDSGIQSVDNSPLHLLNPVSPPPATSTSGSALNLPTQPTSVTASANSNSRGNKIFYVAMTHVFDAKLILQWVYSSQELISWQLSNLLIGHRGNIQNFLIYRFSDYLNDLTILPF